MNKTKKPTIDEQKLGVNPFLANLKVPINTITIHGTYKPDKEGHLLPVEVELERDTYCRIYIDGGRRLQMVRLSPRAKDLLLWVMYESENGRDYLWINKARYMKECNVRSYNTYREALHELVRHSFIQITTVSNVFWINPHLFFNGSRIARFPDNIVKK